MKNSFDDTVRKKWEEKQFPIDDAHRQDMITLLDQQPRRRTAIFWWFGAGGIIISVASALLFLTSNDIPQQPVAPTQQIQNNLPNNTLQSSDTTASNTEVPLNENENATASIINNENVKNLSVDENRASNISTSKTSNRKSKTYSRDLKDNQPTQTPSIEVASTPSGATLTQNVQDVNSNALEVVNTSNPDQQSTRNNDEIVAQEINSSSEKDNINSIEKDQMASMDKNVVASEATLPVEPVIVARNSKPTSPIEDLLFASIPIDERELHQSSAPVIIKRHPIAIYAEATAGYVPSPARLVSSGSSVRAGAGVSYGLASGLQLSASGGYTLQKDGFEFQKTSTSNFPGFGARSNFHTLTPDKLHFVYARFGVHKRIHRHIFSIFGGTQYLYGAQGNIVIQTQDQLAGEFETSKYAWLKLDGMQRWLWNAEATYGYQVTPRLSAHAGVRYYFSKISSDPVEGYYLDGKLTAASPFLTLNYHLYGTR